MSQPTVAAGFVSGLLDYAVLKGAPRKDLLFASGLSEDDIADQDARVPLSGYHGLIGAAIEATGDKALLVRYNLDTELETMSIVGQILHSSRSMLHSMEQLNRYIRLAADIEIPGRRDRFDVDVSKGEVWIVDHLPMPATLPLAVEASFARFISEFRRSFPDRIFAIEMEVTHSPTFAEADYAALLGIPVHFRRARNALRIDPSWLSTDFEPGKDYVFSIFTRHADTLLEDLSTSGTARALVEGAILPGLHEGSLSMDKVARNLGMSRQTLYRRLKEEGVTFAEVHDDLRRRMALDYLSARKVSVNETAYLLGFSEASSFVRAFRRWTGLSPTRWLAEA